jgi:hypothetical protein
MWILSRADKLAVNGVKYPKWKEGLHNESANHVCDSRVVFAEHVLLGVRVDAMGRTPGSIVTTGPMTVARFDQAAVLLPTGRVLIVGGIERNGVMQPSAELFDPATAHFTTTGRPLTQHGWGATATLLEDGQVLVAGGSTGCDSPCYSASAELYDPAKGTFTKTGNMTVPRAEARAIRLRAGDVLLVGGTAITEENPVLTAELYHHHQGLSLRSGPVT